MNLYPRTLQVFTRQLPSLKACFYLWPKRGASSKRRIMLSSLLVVGLASVGFPAQAEQYPDKAITTIVGYSAGGGTDTYARVLASVIPEYINQQPLIIVNKAGGAQIPSMKFTSAAKPDGYTLQFFSGGSGIVATTLRDRGINFLEDFVPIAQIGNINQTIVAHKNTGYKTPQDIVDAVKKAHSEGRKLRWAHTGRGTITNLAAIAWLIENDIYDMVQDVPFKGGSPTRAALVGEQVDFGAMGLHLMTGFEDSLNQIGSFSPDRDTILKDALTMEEQGSPHVQVYSPMIMGAPKGTPQEVIDTMAAAIKQATEHKAFQKLTKKAGLAVVYRGPEETAQLLQKLSDEWSPTIDFVKQRLAAE